MKPFLKTQEEAEAVAAYLLMEFGDFAEYDGVVTPPLGANIEIPEPLECPFNLDRQWGTRNLPEDGCIPAGRYRVQASDRTGMSQQFIDLVPETGPTITACSGYAGASLIDWRGTKNKGLMADLGTAERFAKLSAVASA